MGSRSCCPTIRIKTEKNQAKSELDRSAVVCVTNRIREAEVEVMIRSGPAEALFLLLHNQQLAQPNPEPPVIEHSTLIIRPSVIADPKSLPHMKGQVGMLDSPPDAPPSRGSGPGSGIGPGIGPGYGPGKVAMSADGPNRIGGGPHMARGDGSHGMTDKLKPTILYREKAKYTEAARQNKIQGTVMLTIVFGADGRIHDIRTVRGLPDGLTESSIEAAQKIRFHPAVQTGSR